MSNAKQAALSLLVGRKAAKSLAARFDDVGAIFSHVAPIVDAKAQAKLDAIRTLAFAMTESNVKRGPALSSFCAVKDYLRMRLVDLGRERFHCLYLDRQNQLIADDLVEGTVDHVPVYPREIARRALELNACSIILAHNHPSGNPTPSSGDVAMTKQIVDVLKGLDIAVHDHFIIAGSQTTSLRQLNLM